MKFIKVLSLTFFIIFFAAYTMKLIVLHKKYNISANVLGKGRKGRAIETTELLVRATTFFWGAVWLLESLDDNVIRIVFKDLFTNVFINFVGIKLVHIIK